MIKSGNVITVTCEMPEEMFDILKEQAEEENLSISQAVRIIVFKELLRHNLVQEG